MEYLCNHSSYKEKLNIALKLIKYWSFKKKLNRGGVPFNFYEGLVV